MIILSNYTRSWRIFMYNSTRCRRNTRYNFEYKIYAQITVCSLYKAFKQFCFNNSHCRFGTSSRVSLYPKTIENHSTYHLEARFFSFSIRFYPHHRLSSSFLVGCFLLIWFFIPLEPCFLGCIIIDKESSI